ncbi:MAG: hypothetical protein S4CHLAM7_00500 [Chlamydiae bacterium]|nr:hypothetical protein [Chlamydiota bacterium]
MINLSTQANTALGAGAFVASAVCTYRSLGALSKTVKDISVVNHPSPLQRGFNYVFGESQSRISHVAKHVAEATLWCLPALALGALASVSLDPKGAILPNDSLKDFFPIHVNESQGSDKPFFGFFSKSSDDLNIIEKPNEVDSSLLTGAINMISSGFSKVDYMVQSYGLYGLIGSAFYMNHQSNMRLNERLEKMPANMQVSLSGGSDADQTKFAQLLAEQYESANTKLLNAFEKTVGSFTTTIKEGFKTLGGEVKVLGTQFKDLGTKFEALSAKMKENINEVHLLRVAVDILGKGGVPRSVSRASTGSATSFDVIDGNSVAGSTGDNGGTSSGGESIGNSYDKVPLDVQIP